MGRIPEEHLRKIRNNIEMETVLSALCIPIKEREGFLRFKCLVCAEMNTAVNPRTNLARCFACKQNFNTIEMVMTKRNCSFKHAVALLSPLLKAN